MTLLKHAKFLIGNSSTGVRETSIYGIPSIDIGSRQKNRYDLNTSKNILHVTEEESKILEAIKNISKYKTKSMVFGSGNSTELFLKEISKKDFWLKDLQKVFIDRNNEA